MGIKSLFFLSFALLYPVVVSSQSIGGGMSNASFPVSSLSGQGQGFYGGFNCTNCTPGQLPQGMYPTFGSNSQHNSSQMTQGGTISSAGSLVSKAIKLIPDKGIKDGMEEYLKVNNPSAYNLGDSFVGFQNSGMASYFTKRFNTNQCFQNTAKEFYKEVSIALSKQAPCNDAMSGYLKENLDYFYGCDQDRPKIDEKVGHGKRTNFDEGWLLRLALKHSRGNPEAALELIGMCGHDDANQGFYSYFDDSPKGVKTHSEKIEKLKADKQSIDQQLAEAYKKFAQSEQDKEKVYALGQQGSFLSSLIKQHQASKPGNATSLVCPPQSSAFFLPGSLSEKANISPDLIAKVKEIQSPNAQASTKIPAKHYHAYSSALLGCKMVGKGMSPKQAVTVQKQAARLYRGVRMCTAASTAILARESLAKKLGLKDLNNSQEVEKAVLNLWQSHLDGDFSCMQFKISDSSGGKKSPDLLADALSKSNQKLDPEKCEVLDGFNIRYLEKSEKNVVVKKVSGQLERADAFALYQDWYLGGGKIAGKQIPCSDFRLKGPSDLLKPNEGLFGKISKPSGWSDARYQQATRRLATFDVDFEWTIAQHEAGSKFGADLCAEGKDKPHPFENESCINKTASPQGFGSGFPMMSTPASPAKGVK